MSEQPGAGGARDFLISPVGYLRALAANVHLIVLGTVLTTAAGVGAVLMLPAQYSASASLLVSPPPFKDIQAVGPMMPRALGVPDYEILLTSDGILMDAAMKLDTAKWTPAELERIRRISVLQNALKLKTEISQKTVSVTAYSPVIVLTATADSPEHARDLVVAWSTVCQSVSRQAYEMSKAGIIDVVKDRFEMNKEAIREIDTKIRDEEIVWNDELARAQLTKAHSRYLEYKEKIIDQNMKIATTEDEIADLEQRLATEPEFLRMYKSPPMTAVFMDSVKKGDKDAPQGYIEDALNPIQIALEEKLNTKRGDLINLKEYTAQMEAQVADVELELQTLREENARKSYDRKMLNLEETSQMRGYDMLAAIYEQAKFVAADDLLQGDIKVISQPVLPDRKSWPPRTLFVLLAAFSGFFLSAAFVLLREAVSLADLKRAV